VGTVGSKKGRFNFVAGGLTTEEQLSHVVKPLRARRSA
jgi:hypothetical protein